MGDINIDGDINAGNANVGGTQNFYGDVYFVDPSGKQQSRRKPRVFLSSRGRMMTRTTIVLKNRSFGGCMSG